MTRCRALAVALALLATTMDQTMSQHPDHDPTATAADHGQGLLGAQPRPPSPGMPAIGTQPLGIDPGPRDGLLHVPAGYRADRPAPAVLLLHGAGGRGEDILPAFQALADEAGVILVVPSSQGRTWDIILGDYGPDVARIDAALARVFDRYAVDPTRIAVAGFSDGASYALSLGVMNGGLFTHVLAYAPGFLAPTTTRGAPVIYITHGTGDPVLPIERCSRRIVPRLENAEYAVIYREFDGGHLIPPDLARESFGWFLGGAVE